jgi:hypothetical protein
MHTFQRQTNVFSIAVAIGAAIVGALAAILGILLIDGMSTRSVSIAGVTFIFLCVLILKEAHSAKGDFIKVCDVHLIWASRGMERTITWTEITYVTVICRGELPQYIRLDVAQSFPVILTEYERMDILYQALRSRVRHDRFRTVHLGLDLRNTVLAMGLYLSTVLPVLAVAVAFLVLVIGSRNLVFFACTASMIVIVWSIRYIRKQTPYKRFGSIASTPPAVPTIYAVIIAVILVLIMEFL